MLVILFLLLRLHSKQTLLLEMQEKVHIPTAADGNFWLLIRQSFPLEGKAEQQDRRASPSSSCLLEMDW